MAAIKTFVAQKENQVTNTIEVAPEKHRLLIGRGGETRQNLESKFSVNVDIPKQTVQGAARSQVKISGEPDNVDKAKDHILNMIKEQQGETIQVPLALHHIVSDNGQFFRRLRNDHRVTVDHAGQQPPKTTTKKAPAPTGEGTSMPLITDEQDSADNYSWEVIHSSPDGGVEGDIPWILRGSPENIAKAKTLLEKALSQAKVPSSTGFLVLPDPRSFKYVVGPGGSQINSIKKQTGCKLTVPRSQAPGDAIEVVGTKESVEQAKDLILDAVKKGGSNRR